MSLSTYSSPFSALIFASIAAFCSVLTFLKSILPKSVLAAGALSAAVPNHLFAGAAGVSVDDSCAAPNPRRVPRLFTVSVYFSPCMFFSMKQ